jgi:arsenate reductase (glutaredoxin)
MSVAVWHNFPGDTSRKVPALMRARGIQPTIIDDLRSQPRAATIKRRLEDLGRRPRDLLGRRGTSFGQRGLGAAEPPSRPPERVVELR